MLNSFKQEEINNEVVETEENSLENTINNWIFNAVNYQPDNHNIIQKPLESKNVWENHEKLIRRQNDLIKALSKEVEQLKSTT